MKTVSAAVPAAVKAETAAVAAAHGMSMAALLRELDHTCRTVRLLGVYTK